MRLRVIFLTAIASAFLAVLAWGVKPYNSSGGWACFSGTCVIGHAQADAITIVTDGGTVTVDGDVAIPGSLVVTGTITASGGQAWVKGPFVTLASGALTINSYHLATAAADYDIPATACDASGDIGNWITVIVQDKNEAISIQPLDVSNQIFIPGADIDAGHEVDSEADANNGAGDHLTLVCVVADKWFATSMGGVWVDGGAAD
jgi:hypothetical protein